MILCVVAAPSAIVAAIQSTGRDAILRGTGGSNSKILLILIHVLEYVSTDITSSFPHPCI